MILTLLKENDMWIFPNLKLLYKIHKLENNIFKYGYKVFSSDNYELSFSKNYLFFTYLITYGFKKQ